MRILDKYIIKEYLKSFLVILLAFSVLFIVIEISDRLPRLLRHDASFENIVFYFLLRLPYLFLLTFPVVVLLSGLFLMSNLSKHHESVAMRAAGISIFRIILPLLGIGFIFSIIVMLLGEFVLPPATALRQKIYTEEIKNQKLQDKKMRSKLHYRGKNNNLYYINFFDGYHNKLKIIDITTFNPQDGSISKKIQAPSAQWENNNWFFKNCYIREFDNGVPLKTEFYESTTIEELDARPIDFIKSAKKPSAMNFFELKEYIERLKKVGENYNKELVELNFKISFPFANLIILLFTVPLVSSSSRSQSRGLIFALGVLVCFLFLSMLRLSQSMGYHGILSPMFAAWMPNILFTLIGIGFIIKAEV